MKPWKVSEFVATRIEAVDGKTIANMTEGTEEAKRNAELIVRAVNTFEDMKKALWACQVFLIDDDIFSQTKELRRTVEDALAKAEGK